MNKALVKVPLAPYYLEAKQKSELDDEGWYGQEVEVLEALENGFYRINAPYRYETIAHESVLCFDEGEIAVYKSSTGLKRVWMRSADVLDEAQYRGGILLSLCRGAIIDVVENASEKNGWAKVRLIGGEIGFIKESWIGELYTSQNGDEENFRNAVVETALSYIGAHYRWGGKSPNGIDCSGLTGGSYMLNGVYIYRNANIVEGYSLKEIERKNMKKGDLIFFKGHVAMYIGDARYVHSTGRAGDDGVVINSLDASHEDYRKDLAESILAIGSIF